MPRMNGAGNTKHIETNHENRTSLHLYVKTRSLKIHQDRRRSAAQCSVVRYTLQPPHCELNISPNPERLYRLRSRKCSSDKQWSVQKSSAAGSLSVLGGKVTESVDSILRSSPPTASVSTPSHPSLLCRPSCCCQHEARLRYQADACF